MIKPTIDIPLNDESGDDFRKLAKELELVLKLWDSKLETDVHVKTFGRSITINLDTSKCSKKAPQSVLKAVSDSLDRVYSEGFKQAKNEKFSRVSYVPYDFPEYSHEGSTIICKAADLKDPTSKGYGRFIEEYNKYMSALGHTKPQKYKGDI